MNLENNIEIQIRQLIPGWLCQIQLHGHMHEKRPNKLVGRQLNLSIEVWDYKPVPEKTIIALLDRGDPILKPQSLTVF